MGSTGDRDSTRAGSGRLLRFFCRTVLPRPPRRGGQALAPVTRSLKTHDRPSHEAHPQHRPFDALPTLPDKVLAAARKFALEKFALQHRYAMVLHTDQKHPHVHLVVKAESEDGRRLHIDKNMRRHWREDFAQAMRQQGIAANATPRFACGRNKVALTQHREQDPSQMTSQPTVTKTPEFTR